MTLLTSPVLVVLVGLPGAGKSTFFRAHFGATHLHLSKDLWPSSRRRDEKMLRFLDESLRAGRSVVVDNTSVNRSERAPWLRVAQEAGARVVGYVFEPDVSACLARNAGREGRARVPDFVIEMRARAWEAPEESEGFAQLFWARAGRDIFEVRAWRPESDASAPL